MSGYRTFLRLGELSDGSLAGAYQDAIELDRCVYSFEQEIDESGKVQAEVVGGTMVLTINSLPNDELLKWGVELRIYQSGVIILYDDNDSPIEKTFFEGAACVGLKIGYEREGKGYASTQLVLQARSIKIDNSTKLDNQWT